MNFRLLVLFFFLAVFSATAQSNITVEATQRSLVSKRTATWCPLCGNQTAWGIQKQLIAEQSTNALVIGAHHSSSSMFYSATAEDFINNFEQSFGQPIFFFNTSRIGNGGESTYTQIADRVSNASMQAPLAQSGIEVLYDEAKELFQINTNTIFFNSTNGDYYLGYYLIENEIVAPQASRTNNETHENILWETVSSSSFGDPLASGDILANSSFEKSMQFQLPEGLSASNLTIAAMIWELNSEGKYEFINLIRADRLIYTAVTDTRSIPSVNSFIISPNVSSGSALVNLELNETQQDLRMDLFSVHGQLIKPLFQGKLNKGRHFFELNIEDAGMYLVSIRSGDGIITKRLIIN